jgi:hypothetical protein
MLEPRDPIMFAGDRTAVVQIAMEGGIENVVDQRTLARATDTGDAGKAAQREGRIDRFEVVVTRPMHGDPGDRTVAGGAVRRGFGRLGWLLSTCDGCAFLIRTPGLQAQLVTRNHSRTDT